MRPETKGASSASFALVRQSFFVGRVDFSDVEEYDTAYVVNHGATALWEPHIRSRL
jgi:hypothetical protein